jgi:hypothetical protein
MKILTVRFVWPIVPMLGLAGGALGQEYIRPNDQEGIGAERMIGRGTSPGEHLEPVAPYQPTRAATYVIAPRPTYVIAPRPRPTLPTRIAVNRSASIPKPAETAPALVELILPALARENPYAVYHRGWINSHWNVSTWRREVAQSSSSSGFLFKFGMDIISPSGSRDQGPANRA